VTRALEPGARLAGYEILAFVGRGGMGEVYRARDEKLGREVALKVLPGAFASDPDRLARFHREARSLAALNHPGIAAVYGLEELEGEPFLVLELVEGEDLSARLERGPIPVAEALGIARQMAEALEEAHEKGLVHRDLKPANVKLTPDGRVKLLDFGLAKALAGDEEAPSSDESHSPTLSARSTAAGMILGTAAYMAPEQAKGRPVDRRADIWAFGCVLYEMLTGRRAFEGDGVSDTLAAVLRSDVDLAPLPDAPPQLRPVLAACLQREPKRRLHAIADVRLALEGVLTSGAPAAGVGSARAGRLLAAGLAAVATALAGGLLWVATPSPGDAAGPVAFSEAPPPGMEFVRPPMPSPDGRQLAMLVRDDRGETQVWVRALDETSPRRLEGTEGATVVFWSPDGQQLAFGTSRDLRRIGRRGEGATLIASLRVSPLGGGVWTEHGDIIVSQAARGLVQVAAAGGTPHTLLRREGVDYLSVTALGRARIAFREFGDEAGVYAAGLDGSDRVRLAPGGGMPAEEGQVRLLPPDMLLYRGEGGVLLAQRLDLARPAVVGDPIALAEPLQLARGFETSASGVLTYLEGEHSTRLVWMDRQGSVTGSTGEPGRYEEVHLSPDGKTLLFVRAEPVTGNRDLWVQDPTADVAVRFTVDAAADHLATFSPDGRRVAWETHRGGSLSLAQGPLDGSSPASPIREWGRAGGTEDWSPDGRFILYWSDDGETQENLWAIPVDGVGEPTPVLDSPFSEWGGRYSPDGEFLAYVSDETGQPEIYVQRLSGQRPAGGKRRVSVGGGLEPRWRRDGSELFFLSGRTLMVSQVRRQGDTLLPGPPRPLFTLDLRAPSLGARRYDVTPDGQRVVAAVNQGHTRGRPAAVVLHWTPGARD